jgi:putative ABC transport system permease protein
VLAYWHMAVTQARSLATGSVFVAIVVGAMLIFAAAGLGCVRAARAFAARSERSRAFVVPMAALSLARQPAATVTSFVALGLGALLVTLVPEIRGLIRGELEEPEGGRRPSLFLFDIQPDQQAELEAIVGDAGTSLAFASPMIRARLTAVNGAEVAAPEGDKPLTRADEEERRTMYRGYNLTYRAES